MGSNQRASARSLAALEMEESLVAFGGTPINRLNQAKFRFSEQADELRFCQAVGPSGTSPAEALTNSSEAARAAGRASVGCNEGRDLAVQPAPERAQIG